jgi:hypothetical protein
MASDGIGHPAASKKPSSRFIERAPLVGRCLTRASLSGFLLLQAGHVKRFEIDRLQHHRSKTGAGDGVGDHFASVGEENVGAGNRQQGLHVLAWHVLHAEDPGLPDLDEKTVFSSILEVTVVVRVTSKTPSPIPCALVCNWMLTLGDSRSRKICGALGTSTDRSLM